MGQDPAQRGCTWAVRACAGVHRSQRGGRSQPTRDAHAPQCGRPPRFRDAAPRKALRRRKRLWQTRKLVDANAHGREPPRAGAGAQRKPALPGLSRRYPTRRLPSCRGPAGLDRQPRQRLPARCQRSAPRDHIGVSGRLPHAHRRRHRERTGGQPTGGPGDDRTRRKPPSHHREGQHRPQPHLAFRLHRQQVRVPDGRFLAVDLRAERGAQHRGRRGARRHRRAPPWRCSTPRKPRRSSNAPRF